MQKNLQILYFLSVAAVVFISMVDAPEALTVFRVITLISAIALFLTRPNPGSFVSGSGLGFTLGVLAVIASETFMLFIDNNSEITKGKPSNFFYEIPISYGLLAIGFLMGFGQERKFEHEEAYLKSNPFFGLPVVIALGFIGFQIFTTVQSARIPAIGGLLFMSVFVLAALNRRNRVQNTTFELIFSGSAVIYSAFIFLLYDLYMEPLQELRIVYFLAYYLGTYLLISGLSDSSKSKRSGRSSSSRRSSSSSSSSSSRSSSRSSE